MTPAGARALILAALLAQLGCASQPEPAASAPSRIPDVVFVPTPHRVVDEMLEVARVGPGDVLYDLGSGDGRIVIAASRRFGIRAVGIDIDPKRIEESRFNADTARVSQRVEFRTADLFETDLRPASVVTLYLLPELNVKLRPKLFTELRPGSRVVSHSFDMGDWKADSTLIVDARLVYYWVIPANVAGTWNITVNGSGYEIALEQRYQRVTMTAAAAVPLHPFEIRGDSVRFALDGADNVRQEFRGTVSGDTMTGIASSEGRAPVEWRAVRRPQGGRKSAWLQAGHVKTGLSWALRVSGKRQTGRLDGSVAGLPPESTGGKVHGKSSTFQPLRVERAVENQLADSGARLQRSVAPAILRIVVPSAEVPDLRGPSAH